MLKFILLPFHWNSPWTFFVDSNGMNVIIYNSMKISPFKIIIAPLLLAASHFSTDLTRYTNMTFEFRNKSLISCGISNEHSKKNPVNLFFLSSFSTLWCYCLLFWTKKIVHLCVALCKLSYQTLAHRLTGTFSL